MQQQTDLERISQLLARLPEQVKILNSNGEFSINIHAENMLIKVLDELYDCKLKNTNYTGNKSYPGIDLGDKEKRIAFQVTSTAKMDKIKHTLSQFIDKGLYRDYDRLYIFIITNKLDSYNDAVIQGCTAGKIAFSSRNIMDRTDIYLALNSQNDLLKTGRVRQLLEAQLADSRPNLPIDAAMLRQLTAKTLPDQIRQVGQDKYIRGLYISRDADKQLMEFCDFEQTYLKRVGYIFSKLQAVRANYSLPLLSADTLKSFEQRLSVCDQDSSQSLMDELQRMFHFKDVVTYYNSIEKVVMSAAFSPGMLAPMRYKLKIGDQPFIDERKYSHFELALPFIKGQLVSQTKQLSDFNEFVQIFPSWEDHSGNIVITRLANDLLLELSNLVSQYCKRCLVLVDKAGSGKTNHLCRLAEDLVSRHPVVLLNGMMDVTNEYTVERHIETRLEQELGGFFSDWINRINESLLERSQWLFILIDGINESSHPVLLLHLFKQFLPKTLNKRIKLVLSCRDLSWDFFRKTFLPYQFGSTIGLKGFSDKEWNLARTLYLQKFNIVCQIEDRASEALKNPLLLRFFCEANRDRNLERVKVLDLQVIFQLYLDRVDEGVRLKNNSVSSQAGSWMLLHIADQMWTTRTITLNEDFIHTLPGYPGNSQGVYDLLLSENVVLNAPSHPGSLLRYVRFVYDEFMEFMVAKSWRERIARNGNGQDDIASLIAAVIDQVDVFGPAFGAILFLDKIMDLKGNIANQFIVQLSRKGKHLPDIQMIYALENLNVEALDDEMIEIVRRFQAIVRSDLRDRLSLVVLRILQKRPNLHFATSYISQVLDVWDRPKVRPLKKLSASEKEVEEMLPLLPPAREHYSINSKLTAIAILVNSNDNLNNTMISEGIKQISSIDLNGALESLRRVKEGTVELIHSTVDEYIGSSTPEFRIYAAWLLKERYGLKESEFLVRLLLDRETRVHQFVFNLFSDRLLEASFVGQVFVVLRSADTLPSWHLEYLIKLLGRKSMLCYDSPEEYDYDKISHLLGQFLDHPKPAIRLAAYRSLLQYPDHFDRITVYNKMSLDSDYFLRAFALKHFVS